jgi:hypothetical protein
MLPRKLAPIALAAALFASACNAIFGIEAPSPNDSGAQDAAGETGTGDDSSSGSDAPRGDAPSSVDGGPHEAAAVDDAVAGGDGRGDAISPAEGAPADASTDSRDATNNDTVDAKRIDDGGRSEVVFRGSSSATSRTDVITIDTPPFVAKGDLLWLTLYTDFPDTEATPPAGWIPKGKRTNQASQFRSWWFYQFASGDGGPHVIQLNQVTASAAAIVAYAGVDMTTPFDTGTAADIAGNPFVAPSVSTSRSGLVVITSFINDGNGSGTWMAGPGLNPRIEAGFVFVADFLHPGGDTGTKSATSTKDGDGSVAVVPLVPAGG